MPSPRDIPSIDLLRKRGAVQRLEARYGSGATLDALRAAADAARLRLRAPAEAPAPGAEPEDLAGVIEAEAGARLLGQFQGSLRPVVNATGVIIHTNLGRAPLARAAIDRLAATAGGYTNLEYDLARGERGSRAIHAEALLTILTGAEAAVVVNNNAAATLLMLAALARGREVLISRGELVEIGGGFRVPDVMAQSGADLREVGTTNRTRVADYTVAAGPRTALILRVHPSNFRVEGFTERPTLSALVEAGRSLGLPVVEDIGSGNLDEGLADEPSVRGSLAAGVDLVCFSGDKLLGGPQAGILAGRRALIDQLRRHPLMRAFRVDKLTYAALEATLLEYLAGRATETVPVRRMLAMDVDAIEARARALADRLLGLGWRVTLVSGSSAVGGGSAPGLALPTVLVALEREGLTADTLESRLRALDPPVIARIVDDRVALDLRTVPPESDEQLGSLLERAGT
ncbi:MAG: L-seryl-tRNA(Sec) selenium transferase [Acidobacteria bacterium]|nr:L-seryl-tRNA(Sec) selenium transferase [Acidobacteriota bacterium]